MFITFEGIEGCGKTTQVKRLADRLRELAIPVTLTREPGGTRLGQDIRKILLDPQTQGLTPLTELMLYAADRAQHLEEIIKPALKKNAWVLCDRFTDATTAYQGYARGQDMKLIQILNEKTTLGVSPDITILLDCPVAMGLKRALDRNRTLYQKGHDRFEMEAETFHEAVRKGYLSIAGKDPDRFIVVDGTLNEDDLEDVIFGHIRAFL